MSNICDVCYVCTGPKKMIRSLHKTLKYLQNRKTPVIKGGCNNMWLGTLIYKLDGDYNEISCRGEIQDFYLNDDGTLTINQVTAWAEQEEVRIFLEHKFPGMKIYYREEEPGCEIFNTNDADGIFFKDRYFLDGYEQQEYYETIEQAQKDVEKIVGYHVDPTVENIQEALDKYVEAQEDEDLFYSFHEFTVTE